MHGIIEMTVDGSSGRDESAWPFVVTRNRLLDWRPIVAPDFMIAKGGEYLLVHGADPGDGPTPSPLFERILSSERYGDLTLLARSLQATADLIGGSPQQQLLDQAGRPIQLIEGLVLPGRHPGCTVRWAGQFGHVDALAHQAFPAFWQSEDEAAAPVPSLPLTETSAPPTGMGSAAQPDARPDDLPLASDDAGRPETGLLVTGASSRIRRLVIITVTVIVGIVVLHILIRITRR